MPKVLLMILKRRKEQKENKNLKKAAEFVRFLIKFHSHFTANADQFN
jgi:hypothetical protein